MKKAMSEAAKKAARAARAEKTRKYRKYDFEKDVKDECCKRCARVPGRDPERWRFDANGVPVLFALKGREGLCGWVFDHIIPKCLAKKGCEKDVKKFKALDNCQVLQSRTNKRKGTDIKSGADLKDLSCELKLTDPEMDLVELAVHGGLNDEHGNPICNCVSEGEIASDMRHSIPPCGHPIYYEGRFPRILSGASKGVQAASEALKFSTRAVEEKLSKEGSVRKGQKSEREKELKRRFEQSLRDAANESQGLNLYLRNFVDIGDQELHEMLSKFGKITYFKVMRDENGCSQDFAYAGFSTCEEASQALTEMNGKMISGKPLYVAFASEEISLKKGNKERSVGKIELKRRFEQSLKDSAEKYQGLNLYLKNLDDSIGDAQLNELFSNFGKISSAKVTRDQNGLSKGSGFVAFSTREEASQALTEMNGKMISGKPLYVAFASEEIALKKILGENLYPLVQKLKPNQAAKVIGMLLEMDQIEVLHLLESPYDLKSMVAEAMDALRNVSSTTKPSSKGHWNAFGDESDH